MASPSSPEFNLTLQVPAVFLIPPVCILFHFHVVSGIERLIPAELEAMQKHKPFQLVMVFPAGGAA